MSENKLDSKFAKQNNTHESTYKKIPNWLSQNKDLVKRTAKIDKDGNPTEKNASLFPCLKAVVFGQSKVKNFGYNETRACVKYLIEDVMEITPDTFYALYDTKLMKQYKIYSSIMKLIKMAPESIQRECCFSAKDILYKSLWSDFYDKNFSGPSAREIFFADNDKKDNLKAYILRAGKVNTISSKDKGTQYGDAVDKILYDTIDEVLFNEDNGLCRESKLLKKYGDNIDRAAFEVLAKYSSLKPCGANEIATSRGYKTLLDFWYLNLPKKYQEKYGMDFLATRKDPKYGIERDPILEIGILAHLGKVDELRQYAFLGGEDATVCECYRD